MWKGSPMIRFKIGAGLGFGAALILGASPALAASGWTVAPIPPTGQNGVLYGVAAPSDTNAWAVGYSNAAANGLGAKAVIDHWNGTAWSQATAPAISGSADLLAASSSGANDAWAVGYYRIQRYTFYPLALRWNGTAWATSPSATSAMPTNTILYGVADISPTDAWAFGNNATLASGELAQWNGSTWSRVTYPLPTSTGYSQTLNGISADSPSDVWIVGSYLLQVGQSPRWETFSDHWNGSTWSVVPMPLVGGSDPLLTYQINAMDAISPTNVWAVGGSGDNASPYGGSPTNTLAEHWDGTAWRVVPSPSPGTSNSLTGVTESTTSNVWAVGYDIPSGATQPQTLTQNWNGTAWTTVASPNQGPAC